MDPIRRKILKTGAGAAAIAAAAPQVLAQQSGQVGAGRFYEQGPVRICYEEAGSGFPLLVIAGGGLNSVMAGLPRSPFNPIEEFKGEYPLHLRRPAQRQSRPVFRPARNRPAMGFLHR